MTREKSEKKSENNSIVRDLHVGRLVEPSPSANYFFHSTFRLSPSLALAVQRNFFEGGTEVRPHKGEDFYSLYIVRGGRGIEIVDEHPYVITRGDVYIVPPGMPHGFRDYEALEMDAFYFQTHLFTRREVAALRAMKGFWQLFISRRGATNQKRLQPRKRRTRFYQHRLHLTPEQHHDIEEVIEEIRHEIDQSIALGPLIARGLFFRLLGTLARWHGSHAQLQEARDEIKNTTTDIHAASISEAIRFCETNFQKKISVRQLAARAFLSPDHFSALFATQVAMPPAAYLRHLRLEHAQSLLRSTTLNIEGIAEQAGFGGAAQLSRAFRARFDDTPSAYRARFRK